MIGFGRHKGYACAREGHALQTRANREFSDTKFPPLAIENLNVGGCQVSNDTNTDGKPGDELSVFTFGVMNKMLKTLYGFNGKKWEQLSSEETTNSPN